MSFHVCPNFQATRAAVMVPIMSGTCGSCSRKTMVINIHTIITAMGRIAHHIFISFFVCSKTFTSLTYVCIPKHAIFTLMLGDCFLRLRYSVVLSLHLFYFFVINFNAKPWYVL